jgi:hypothetical protein
MKNLYLLLLLFIGFTGFAVVPPDIQDPTPLEVCDDNNDGIAVFDLTVKIPEVLGALNSGSYTVTFHETMTDAEINGTSIPTTTVYTNINPNTQIIYIRVEDNTDISSYSLTTLQLIVNPIPNIGIPQDLSIEQIPFIGTAVFDLTLNDTVLANGMSGTTVGYYATLADAQSNVAQISTPSAFIGTNGQQIWARVENAVTGCFANASFHLYITNPDIVFIPDANFKSFLINHSPTIDFNGNDEIEYSEAELFSNVFLLDSSNISDLTGIEAFVNLRQLYCSNNNLTFLDVSGLTNLNTLYCSFNQLTSLNVSGDISLVTLECNNNLLTTLDVSNLSNLSTFFCYENLLTTLNIAQTTNLADFSCGNNQLSSVDVSSSPNLILFGCGNNPISSLNVSNLVNLQNLFCDATFISTLDVSTCTSLNVLAFNDNSNLTSVYMKNGRNEGVNLSNNPNLIFICADETQINNVQQLLASSGMSSTAVNSYCTFTPGGDYNTISTNIRFDSNGNGCDLADISFPNIRLNINDGINSGATFTDVEGTGSFYTQAGTFTISPGVENPAWFTISPASVSVPFSNVDNNVSNQNFCITANGIHPDLEVVIVPITPARPGFDADYKIVYKNKGNQTITHTNDGISFIYDHNRMNLLSTSEPLSLISAPPGTLNWDFLNLVPFESRSILLTFHVNEPTHPTFPVNNGDVLNFTAVVNPLAGDETPADNTFQFNQTVVGSFDPNDITCIQGALVSPIEIGNYLHYVINFENTGTFQAENIVVREVIDPAQFDITSLQVLNSSALMTASITGNVAEFIFSNINLHSGGHGNILLKVRSNNALQEGDLVSKRANIYFDYNFPVETLPANTVFQTLSNPDIPVDATISVYPNPTQGIININCKNTISSIQLYDIQGRIVQTNLVNENQTILDISNQSNGMYFVKITSAQGTKVEKIVKE